MKKFVIGFSIFLLIYLSLAVAIRLSILEISDTYSFSYTVGENHISQNSIGTVVDWASGLGTPLHVALFIYTVPLGMIEQSLASKKIYDVTIVKLAKDISIKHQLKQGDHLLSDNTAFSSPYAIINGQYTNLEQTSP